MLMHIKINKPLYDKIRIDLSKSHPYSYERVGFMFARQAIDKYKTMNLLVSDYKSVPDTQYLRDYNVGAKINSTAIRSVMEKAFNSKESILHVHQHEHYGVPRFSRVDRKEYNKMIRAFHNIGGGAVHGALVFSHDKANGLIWTNKTESPNRVNKISIVGFPFQIYGQRAEIYA